MDRPRPAPPALPVRPSSRWNGSNSAGDARARNVLAVPVSALVALAGGGYAVDVVHGGSDRLVAVRTGLFTSSLVQVTGAGLGPGVLVQVPAP